MVGRSNYGSLVEEGQTIYQRGLEMSPPPRRPQTSYHNGRSPQEQLQNIRKRIRMKVCGMSLGIDMSHGDFPINSSAGLHWPLHTGPGSWGVHNNEILGQDASDFASGGVWEGILGGEVSVVVKIFYTGTCGIILRSSLVIYWQGTWDFKNSFQTSKYKYLNSTDKPFLVEHSPHNLLCGN